MEDVIRSAKFQRGIKRNKFEETSSLPQTSRGPSRKTTSNNSCLKKKKEREKFQFHIINTHMGKIRLKSGDWPSGFFLFQSGLDSLEGMRAMMCSRQIHFSINSFFWFTLLKIISILKHLKGTNETFCS